MSYRICPECGARNPEEATRCDLCGLEIDGARPEAPPTAPEPVEEAARPDAPGAEAEAGAGKGVYCNACGWHNPPGARFCSQCGARLQETAAAAAAPPGSPARPSTPPPSPSRTASAEPADTRAVARQLSIVVGAAVLLVVALFVITDISNEQATAPTPAARAADGSAPVLPPLSPSPLPAEQEGQAADLRAEAAALEGEARRAKQRALVELLISFGRPDHAAVVQEELARAVDTPEAWRRAGDLFFDWMEGVPETQRPSIALHAIDAYERVLEDQPDDLDVRADLGWAYQYDPQHPMQAIQHTNMVLQEEPDHIQANFNRGIFLMRINRVDEAIEQFQRVQEIVGTESPLYGQASEIIAALREVRSGGAGGS